MQCFRIPNSICDDINRMCASFWWGDKDEKRTMHWRKWSKMCTPKESGGMGFRDLEKFNKALLAKQVWRMANRPDSMVARVFKAKYFRNGDIWSAEVKANSSFIWRSLVWSRDTIEKGRSWKVGDGSTISVFKDKWTTDVTGTLLGARQPGTNGDMKVSELINGDDGWDDVKIEQLFLPHERRRILNTPIGGTGRADEIIWRFEDNGLFSVKSAYLAEMGYYESSPNMSSLDRKAWSKAVWSLSIPPKTRVFLWRAYSNLIPTPANLKEHHVPADGTCPLCFDRWGSTEHCLLYCPRVRHTWKASRFWTICRKGSMSHLWDVGKAVHESLGQEEYELWVIMLWKVWAFVCKILHEGIESAEAVTEAECIALWEAYQDAKPTLLIDDHLGVKLGERKWIRPRRGVHRVDVDVLFNSSSSIFGVGVIIRNSEGAITVALSKRTSPSANVMAAEVMAIVHGIILSLEHQVRPVVIYTDSLLAARVMADPEEERNLLPDDVSDILKTARENMILGVNHMYREANRAAHALAQYAVHCLRPSVWVDCFPTWLSDIVSEDLS